MLGIGDAVFSVFSFFRLIILCTFHRFVQFTPFILSSATSVSIFGVVIKTPFGIAMWFAQVSLPLSIGLDF
jgi:hypothetical protein